MSADTSFRLTSYLTIETEWKIRNFSDLRVYPGFYLRSRNFSFADSEWCIQFYPYRFSQDGNNCGSLFLEKKKSSSECQLKFKFDIIQSDGYVHKTVSCKDHLFPPEGEIWGWDEIAFDIILVQATVLPNDALTIRLTAWPKGHNNQALFGGVKTLVQNFKEMYLSGYESDISIRVKNREFKAHKLVLSARSPVFRSMFEHGMIEKISSTVNIDDCDPEPFNDFLLYLYSGKMNEISLNNAFSLYFIADKYRINDLKKVCSECISKEVAVDSVFDVIQLASLHEDAELLEAATDVFIKNADAILKTTKWLSFFTEHQTLANGLLIKMAEKYKHDVKK